MSLINDALKRAREAQQVAAPPVPGPEFRPIEAAQTTGRGVGLMVPLAFLTIALIGLFFAWQVRQKSARSESPALAMPVAIVTPAPIPKPRPSLPVQIFTAPTPDPAAKPLDQLPVAAPTPAPVAVVVTNAPAPVLRLQMITYLPGHPSAVISGKTVQAGDALKGFRIAAITQNSVTLVSATETNVLALDQ